MSSSTTKQQGLDQAKNRIAKAISVGAPAYNSGDIAKCAQVYQSTAVEIAPMLPENLQSAVQSAIDKSYTSVDEEAWAFRSQFDAIMDYRVPFMPFASKDDNNVTLEPFTSNMIPTDPVIVNDNVMGGVSRSRWNSGTFSGTTSLANNGGFASLRWRMNTIQNWSYAKGIYLKVQHSNPKKHTFNLILKDTTCEQVRLSNFKNTFSDPTSTAKEPILIPFEAFDQMEQMGRSVPGPTFNRGAVTELGIMAIKPTVVGDFELKVVEWGLYY